MGVDRLRDPVMNKGTAFSSAERSQYRLRGLLPPRVESTEVQVNREMERIRSQSTELDKFVYLQTLLARNQRLFFQVIMPNIVECMPIIYTPVVGTACQQWGHIYQQPRGMYISMEDKGHIYEVLKNYPEDDIRVIVVTDGERILGLGDLGCFGMGIPIGKLLLYNGCGGVNPKHTLPIQLDTGCNTAALRNDPFYFGIDSDRIRGEQYDEFIDEFMEAVQKRFSSSTLIQFEDFAQANAARLLEKYRHKYCCFNDDIQGTAAVALAGIFGALRMDGVESDLSKHKVLFYGAGSAGIGIADLIGEELVKNKGIDKETAKRSCWFLDSKGLIYEGRANLTTEKSKYAHSNPPHLVDSTLLSAVKAIQPSILIGVSTIANSFSPEIIKTMCQFNDRPIIFALSNPTSKAECTAESCYFESNGKAVFASGSPFDPVTMPNGDVLEPGQANNAYCFPGIGLAVKLCAAKFVSNLMILEAARCLGGLASKERLDRGCLFPSLNEIQSVSAQIASAIAKVAVRGGLATKPADFTVEFVRQNMYNPNYD